MSFDVTNLASHSIRLTRSYKEPNPSVKVTSFNLLIREELLINKSDFIKNEASENLAFSTFSFPITIVSFAEDNPLLIHKKLESKIFLELSDNGSNSTFTLYKGMYL